METADPSKESADSSEESSNSTHKFTNSPQKSVDSPKKSSNSPQKSFNSKESSNSPNKSIDSPQKSADSSKESTNSPQNSVDSLKNSDSSKKSPKSPPKSVKTPQKSVDSSKESENSPNKLVDSLQKSVGSSKESRNSPNKSTDPPQKSVNSPNNLNSPVKCSEYLPDKLSKSEKQTEVYNTDDQHNMISFLIEANRISSCCSIHIWRLMALKRLTRSPESLLEHFKTVIAPNIAQFLDEVGIIGLPGVLEEFRSALNEAGIKENESSSSLFATSSPTPVREPLTEITKRKRDSSTHELVPPKKLKESTESDEENSQNKNSKSSNIRVKIEQISAASVEDEGNGEDTSLDNNNSLLTSMKEEINQSQMIIYESDGDDSDSSIELIESAENIEIGNSKKLEVSVESSGINVKHEEDLEALENLSGEELWEEMYGTITVGKQRNISGRIEFSEKPRRMSERLKPKNFSMRLLNALNRSKSGCKTYCLQEELAILHYFICKPHEIQSCRGKKVFKSIERQKWKVLEGRTWEAMRKRFNCYIIGNIHEFGLPDEILKEFLYWEWNRQRERAKK